MEKLNNTLLYTLDKCFRTYNQFAQRNVRKAGYDITIDQWLILKSVAENPNITQKDMSKIVFKDNASITRIIELLVKQGFLTREVYPLDRRRVNLTLTVTGKKITIDVNEIAIKNRSSALKGIDEESIKLMRDLLQKVIANCTNGS